MTNDTPTLQLAVWDDPLAANGLQTEVVHGLSSSQGKTSPAHTPDGPQLSSPVHAFPS